MVRKIALITGAARRIGAACARRLHGDGFNVVLHYHRSAEQARLLCEELNGRRPDSARLVQADLLASGSIEILADAARGSWGGLDVLVNNASTFYPTPIGQIQERDWDCLFGSNLKAPFFLSQALAPDLIKRRGCIVNIADIHGDKGLSDYSVYSIAKGGLLTMTKVLAKELAPDVRVNAVAPGAILWPEQTPDEGQQAEILQRIALRCTGEAEDIAKAVRFLVVDADYMTGQVLTVDGGRTLFV